MRYPDYLSTLGDLDLLADCSRSELSSTASLLTPLRVPAGETLVRENTIGREFLLIVDGSLEVTQGAGDSARVLGTIGSGEVVGEMALLNGARRTATVRTTTPTTLYAGSAQEFFAFLRVAPSAAERIVSAANRRQQANLALAAA